jgi:hypothetical protein
MDWFEREDGYGNDRAIDQAAHIGLTPNPLDNPHASLAILPICCNAPPWRWA